MDVKECNTKRIETEKKILELLKKLEDDTGMIIGGFENERLVSAVSRKSVFKVSIKLELS